MRLFALLLTFLYGACGSVTPLSPSAPSTPSTPQSSYLVSFGSVAWVLTHVGENVLLRAPDEEVPDYVFRAVETTPTHILFQQAGSQSPHVRGYWALGQDGGPGWFVFYEGFTAEHRRPQPLREYVAYPAAEPPSSLRGEVWIHPLTPPPGEPYRSEPRSWLRSQGPQPPWSHLRTPQRFHFEREAATSADGTTFRVASARGLNRSFQVMGGERLWSTTWYDLGGRWLVEDANQRRFLVAKERIPGDSIAFAEKVREETPPLPAWLAGEWVVSTAQRGRLRLTLENDRFAYVSTARREPFRNGGRLRWTSLNTLVLDGRYRTRLAVVPLSSSVVLAFGPHEIGEVEQPPVVRSPADLPGAVLVRVDGRQDEAAALAPIANLRSDLARFCDDGTEGAFEERWRSLARSPWGLEVTWALGPPAATRRVRLAALLHRHGVQLACPALQTALTRNPCPLETPPPAAAPDLQCPADTQLAHPAANVIECVHRIDGVPHGPQVLRHRDGSVEESCYAYDQIIYLTERDPNGAVRRHHRYE